MTQASQQAPGEAHSEAHGLDACPNTPNVVGVDLSLTSTGVAGPRWVARLTPPKNLDGLARLRWIRAAVISHARDADLVVIEAPAYSRTTGKATERAGLWWLVVDGLDTFGIPVAPVAPTSRARYATGKGNAPKDAVLAAVIRRFPDIDITGNDQADALVLAAMGADHLGSPLVAMPATHRAALDAVTWPPSGQRAAHREGAA